MLIQLALGLVALAGYMVFDKLYPAPEKKKAPKFQLDSNIIYKDSCIYNSPKTFINGKKMCYKFRCRIRPDRARLANGKVLPMDVPDEFIIRTFVVGVDPVDNSVDFVYLGPEQYHCDNDPVSECLCIQHLYKEPLDYEFLTKLLDIMMIYDVDDPMRADHWENKEYFRQNSLIRKAMYI